jgi:hypothetical protein
VKLEKLSWIATIIGTAITVIIFFSSTESQVSVTGSSNTIIQGSNNIISTNQDISKLIREHSNIERIIFPVTRDNHKISYFQFSENIPMVQTSRINLLIKQKVWEIYEHNNFYSGVEISAHPEFIDYGLIGVSVDITLENIDIDVLKNSNVPEKEAIFLIWMAGAHPLQKSTGFVINISNAEPYEFKDLFRHDGLKNVSDIVKTILENEGQYVSCIKEKKVSLDYRFDTIVLNKFLGYRAENCYESVKPDENFYLTQNEVVIKYSRYEIGPGVMGAPEVHIPYEKIKPYINPNGPLSFLH